MSPNTGSKKFAEQEHARLESELAELRQRGRLANGCIALLTSCAFLIGLTIIVLFLGETTSFQGNRMAVGSFLGGGDHSMDMGGDDVLTVAPGDTETMTRTFDDTGTVVIGCHQPGHWESGMKATVTVT